MTLRIQSRTAGMIAALILAGSVVAAPAHPQSTAPSLQTAPLSPAQLNAIRAVGRNVLAAKRQEDKPDTDQVQLEQMRSTVNELLEAEMLQASTVQVMGQQSLQAASEPAGKNRRDQARTHATDLVKTLKNRAKTAKQTSAKQDVGQERMNAQRNRLFLRWAEQLEAALNDPSETRIQKLNQLREAIDRRHGGIEDTRGRGKTPTLQAMPAPFRVEPTVSN